MQTTYLQRQISLMLEAIHLYSSGKASFNMFFHDMRRLLSNIREYDQSISDVLDNILLDMETRYALMSFRGEVDEEKLRQSQLEAVNKMRETVQNNFIFE